MMLWFTGCNIVKVLHCFLSSSDNSFLLIQRRKIRDIILPEIGKLTLRKNSNLMFLQMSVIITWMILEKCLDVDRQYFFIDFLF